MQWNNTASVWRGGAAVADSGPVMQMAVLKQESHYGRECGRENIRISAIPINRDIAMEAVSFKQRVFCKLVFLWITHYSPPPCFNPLAILTTLGRIQYCWRFWGHLEPGKGRNPCNMSLMFEMWEKPQRQKVLNIHHLWKSLEVAVSNIKPEKNRDH